MMLIENYEWGRDTDSLPWVKTYLKGLLEIYKIVS